MLRLVHITKPTGFIHDFYSRVSSAHARKLTLNLLVAIHKLTVFCFSGINENHGSTQLAALDSLVSEMFHIPPYFSNIDGNFTESQVVFQHQLYSIYAYKCLRAVDVSHILYLCHHNFLLCSECFLLERYDINIFIYMFWLSIWIVLRVYSQET